MPASVRQHRRALRACLSSHVGWIGCHAAAPCSPLNDCHPRPVNAYSTRNRRGRIVMIRLVLIAASIILPLTCARAEPPRPRLIVLTDISSLTTGVAEPDDGQSMCRLMLYTNELDIEGLIATSNLGHGEVVRPELIRQVVDAYGRVRPTCSGTMPATPPRRRCRDEIKAGQPIAGPKVPVDPEHRRRQGHRGVGVDHRGRGPARSSPGLGDDLGRLGRPGPGPLERSPVPEPRRIRAVPREVAGPLHRRAGFDRSLDLRELSRPVPDHEPAGDAGHVPRGRDRA